MSPTLRDAAELNRLIHEPSRLMIVSLLFALEKADFIYLLNETGLTRGNLSTHLSKLEEAGYLSVEKTFRGKVPQSLYSLTPAGREAFTAYRQQLKNLVDIITEE